MPKALHKEKCVHKTELCPPSVEFSAVACCALHTAFEEPQNSNIVDTIREKHPGIYEDGKEGTKTFKNTPYMKVAIAGKEKFLRALFLLVSKELLRIRGMQNQSIMACGHRTYEHRMALGILFEELVVIPE